MTALKATKTLPDDYHLTQSLNLTQDSKRLLKLTLISIVIFIGYWIFLSWLVQWLRPGLLSSGAGISFSLTSLGDLLTPFLVLLLVIFVMVVVHEAIHGIFFRVFTGGRVKFAFKWAYAYAAAPDWYLPKRPYLVVCMAPLVVITLLGGLLLLWLPSNWIMPMILLLAMNASGSVGDVYMFYVLSRSGEDTLICDFGEQMHIYTPGAGHPDDERGDTAQNF